MHGELLVDLTPPLRSREAFHRWLGTRQLGQFPSLFILFFTYIIMVCKPLSIAEEVLALLGNACHSILTLVHYFDGIHEMGC